MRPIHFALLGTLLLLAACAQPKPPTATPADSRTELLLDAHSQQISQLQEHIIRLENQIQQLQIKENTSRPRNPSTATSPAQRINATQILAQAQVHQQNKRYNQALQQLNQLEQLNPNDTQQAQALQLRVHIHRAQNNCQSLIIAGQQLAQRFPRHPASADALLHIGHCQWQMQQRDIARNTWRRLIHSHPQSQAAAQARQRLENRAP